MSHKKVEVSAIMARDIFYAPLAITPCGIVYVWRGEWISLQSKIGSDLDHWTNRAYDGTDRRIYRGIFTIKVADNG